MIGAQVLVYDRVVAWDVVVALAWAEELFVDLEVTVPVRGFVDEQVDVVGDRLYFFSVFGQKVVVLEDWSRHLVDHCADQV